jgi:RimJ/RimL family protein N-acetyltransferase
VGPSRRDFPLKTPTLRTGRLRLVPFDDRHASEDYLRWLNDRDLMRYSRQRLQVHTTESCREFRQDLARNGHLFWAIETEHGGVHIGNLVAYLFLDETRADLSILIGHPSAHGMGYGLEAWQAVAGYLMSGEIVQKITAGTPRDNAAMLAIMSRSGMVPDVSREKAGGTEEEQALYMVLTKAASTSALSNGAGSEAL